MYNKAKPIYSPPYSESKIMPFIENKCPSRIYRI